MDEDRKLWEQLDGEPALWFRRFSELYLSQKGQRTLIGAFNAEQARKGREKTANAPQNWRKAFERWQWRLRAEAWDAEQSRLAIEEWERRAAEVREREWEMSRRLHEKALQMLQFPLAKVEKLEGEGGKRTTIIQPADWRLRDVAAIADTAARLARLAAGLETNRELHEHTWRDEVIKMIRAGNATYQDVSEEFGGELAAILFKSAGVPIGQGREAQAADRPAPADGGAEPPLA